ncbi:MAG: 4Fe-4S dicluster domain-containing protein [Oscillospiraceae bacterium]|nr:4Fe-4S dicluster domain-containing protein [Oscillospiraceae bacterium]
MADIHDQSFKDRVAAHPGGEKVLGCFLCGTCTAGCPISELDESYNPRKMMRQILLGLKDEVLGSGEIWKCYQCHTCVAHCPQDVRFADVVRALREIAVEDGVCDAALAQKVAEADAAARKQRLDDVRALLNK